MPTDKPFTVTERRNYSIEIDAPDAKAAKDKAHALFKTYDGCGDFSFDSSTTEDWDAKPIAAPKSL